MHESTLSEKILIFLLRLGGVLMLLAFLAMIMPTEWMVVSHRWLGLGELPRVPVVDYLARSASALYGIHGGLLLVLSSDVRRYRRVVAYVAAMDVVFGVAVTLIDLHAGMPWFWTLSEGPPVIVTGALLLFLLRGVPVSP